MELASSPWLHTSSPIFQSFEWSKCRHSQLWSKQEPLDWENRRKSRMKIKSWKLLQTTFLMFEEFCRKWIILNSKCCLRTTVYISASGYGPFAKNLIEKELFKVSKNICHNYNLIWTPTEFHVNLIEFIIIIIVPVSFIFFSKTLGSN